MTASPRESRPRLALFYASFFAITATLALFFHQGRSWNVDSRLLTVYALVEHHALRADTWRGETGDYAVIHGHVYSDKAPLSSFLVAPLYWAFRAHEHFTPQSFDDHEAANHAGILLAAAIPFALFASLLFARVRRTSASPRTAVWLALLASVGTCLLNYAGFFLGHMLAATFFLAAYALAVDRERHFAVAGFLGSLAVLTEYPLVLTQALVCLYLLLGPSRVPRLARYLGGALPGALLMFAYNRVVTGRFTDFPYSHVPDAWAPMQTAFGVRYPSPNAAWELVFGQYRGLFFYAPTLLLFVPLVAVRFDQGKRRRNLVLGMATLYVLFVASYFKWDGGWCTGPRHLAPIIALLTYEGVGALGAGKRWFPLFTGLALTGALVTVAASATDCIPKEDFKAPAFEVFFPKLANGEINNHALLFELGLHRGAYLVGVWFALLLVSGFALAWLYERAVTPPVSSSPATPS